MPHPTEDQLLAWLDGEPGAIDGGDTVAAHVEQCARCQRWLEGAEQLGSAVRMWAEDAVPSPVEDLADAVLRAAGARVEPRVDGASAKGGGASGLAGGVASAKGGADGAARKVVPIGEARRGWVRVGVPVAAMLAAAAAIVFALHRPGSGALGHGGGGTLAAIESHGSEVLSVESDGTAHNDVSVIDMRGDRQGSTIAVVWIADDEPKPSSGDGSGAGGQ